MLTVIQCDLLLADHQFRRRPTPTTASRTSKLLFIMLYIHTVCGLPSSASTRGPAAAYLQSV